MASSSIRKAIGVVKDQTSISLAKVAGNLAPDLEVLVVKATSHDEVPADDKYIREIVDLTSYSRGYVNACVVTITKRLSKTRDWIVALKALMLLHRLLVYGHPIFEEEIVFATRRGMRILNMSDFRDEAHSNTYHATFMRLYAMYLDEKIEFLVYEKKLQGSDGKFEDKDDNWGPSRRGYGEFGDELNNEMGRRSRSYGDVNESMGKEQRGEVTPVGEMRPHRALDRLNHLLRVLDRILACRPSGPAMSNRLVLVAVYQVMRESFKVYERISDILRLLLDRFTEMEYADSVKAFDAYVSAGKKIDELVGFYNWCKDMGIAMSSEYPEVQRIADKLLETLEGFLKGMAKIPKSPENNIVLKPTVKEPEPDMNEVKALPPPENFTPAPPPASQPRPQPQPQQETHDLVNLKDDMISADEQGNRLALALFSGQPSVKADGSWEAFPSDGEPGGTSAWQTPAAEIGKADWELALVESTSNLSKQKAALAGGFDPLLLNGMYDQGAVRQHVNTSQLTGGSASSVALPGPGKCATPVLALPAPDGTVQAVGQQDPFAASLSVPAPSYVQIAEMERKQRLLVQEQQLWQQYGSSGMQGQVGLAQIAGGSGYYGHSPQPMMPYGMPLAQVSGMGQPGGYYYAPY
ncbi:Epsin N-terminal domain-containing protein / clathrin assembly protein-related [Quillaja saponaria]|uniref:Epsin N-terminal domain-containing protein / clathrin assembly protein-related n=1 Tax=Quillaja saponaria TaxID=32244 RepID=A0AAD7LEL2_QUISA|nr:Epsin N-terminal domain-containing protein / clathrin assembly protein-related [Quillaja saponaria]KAJ7956725.1 Epsin N-terminal domain-containing protein / clathrin assembly protein-related [Quillaja saponaria]